MITKNDLKVIKECLAASGVKNSEFQESTDANKDAYIAFVYNNLNYKIKVSNLIPIKNISLDGIKLIPDDNGNLNIELPKSKWDVITVNYYGNTPPPPQAQEGTLCYNKSEKTLWVYRRPGGWRQAPWEENFYYIKGLDILCLYIPELGLLEIPKDKLDKLISGVNIKTINGQSILGLGDLTINESGTSVTPSVLLPVVGTVVTTENNTNTTEVLNVGEDKSVYYDYRLEKFVVKTLQNVYYTQWEGDYSTSELYESISFVYTEYPETTIYKIDKTRPDTLLPISDCSVIEIVEWANNAEDYPLGYDYPEGSYAISEDYLYRLIDGNWTLVGNTIDSTSPYNKRYYLIYQNALYTYKLTDGITPVIVPVSQDTIDAAIAPINLLLVTINNKLEQDEEDILDLKLITNILLGQKQSPLLVTIVTTNRGIAERTYTGTEGELCYIDSILDRGFAWRVGNTYYSNWTNVKPLPANLVGIDIIFEEKEGILYFYKITESGLELLSMLDVATRNYKELLPIEQIVDGLIIVSQDAPISGGTVIYNPTRKRFYYKDANSLTYHSVWSDDLGVPSYDDYLNADFVYIVDSYLQIYKVTPSGLVGINTINSSELQEEISNIIKNRLCVVIAYEGEDSQEKAGPWKVGEIWYDTINCQFFVCTHEGAIPETEITIPDSCLLYVEQPNGRFYYYNSALDAEPIPLLTVDSALNRNSTNPVENRAIVAALDTKQDKLSIEDEVILDSKNVVTSGAVYQAILQLLPEINPEMAFIPGDGINIYEEVDDATDTRRVVISLSDTALRKLNYDIPALLQRVELIEQKLREKFPDDPVPVVVEFDPTVGNWGDIHINKDPEDIEVADVMHSLYNIDELADITSEDISVWATGDTPPEGSYYITAEKAGLISPYPDGRYDIVYNNRKVLCDITSDTGTYANCVGLVLGYDGNPETYYFDFLPGDGSMRSCTVSGTIYTYQTANEGLLMADTKYWDRGIVIKKNFTIKGMTFDTNNLPTSGLRTCASHDGYITGGPFFYTRHSLNLIGVKFTLRSGYNTSTKAASKAACVIVDSVNGIDQVQIKYCQFAVTGDLYQSAHAITLIGRDENPVDPVTSELKETNCIKDLLIYNNTFAGTGCIMGVVNGSGYTNIPDNYLYARFLNTCRIVGNNFTSASSYAINLAYLNDNREYHLTTAFTQCPVYIVGNTIEGKPGIIDGVEGTQHCSIVIKTGRLFVLHNTIRDYVVRQAGGATTAFAYASGTALYFCNNTCENLAKFSANNTATLILYKTAPVPSTYTNTRYETVRYIYGNTFRLDITTINTWWTNWLNSSSATTTDRSLDFDTCLSIPVLPHTENVVDSITLKNNTFNFRTVYGISPYSASLAKNFVIENNTFNFGVLKFYNDNPFPGLFTIGDIGGEQLNITIRNNRFVTGLPTVRLLTLMNLSGDPVSITFDGNSVPNNVVLNKQEARSNSTNVTITPIYNDSDSEYIIIPPSEITSEEATIINGIGS